LVREIKGNTPQFCAHFRINPSLQKAVPQRFSADSTELFGVFQYERNFVVVYVIKSDEAAVNSRPKRHWVHMMPGVIHAGVRCSFAFPPRGKDLLQVVMATEETDHVITGAR
jgi:hypothetical protein